MGPKDSMWTHNTFFEWWNIIYSQTSNALFPHYGKHHMDLNL